jgi:hypothetical protein
MATFDDAKAIALGLPNTELVKTTFKVGGRNFAAVYPEKVDPKKPRVPNYDVLLVWVADLDDKEAYLQADPAKFFTVQHYDGYPAILVRLAAVGTDELEQLIREAWTLRSPKK